MLWVFVALSADLSSKHCYFQRCVRLNKPVCSDEFDPRMIGDAEIDVREAVEQSEREQSADMLDEDRD